MELDGSKGIQFVMVHNKAVGGAERFFGASLTFEATDSAGSYVFEEEDLKRVVRHVLDFFAESQLEGVADSENIRVNESWSESMTDIDVSAAP